MIRPRRVAPGVELFPARTPTLPPATHTNSYALGRERVILVEPATPYEDERAAWLEWARARAVSAIFLTHHHVDHSGGARFFASALSLPILAHPLTFDRVDLEGVERREVRDGEAIEGGWRALHTPGHAPGHLVLHHEEDRTLVAGDMVANGSTIVIPPEDGGDMAEYIAQLRRLDALASTLMLPAHGEPIDDPRATLRYYVEHRLMRERKVLDAWNRRKNELGREPLVAEIVPLAYDDTAPHLWPIAKSAADAHVIKLRREGRL